MKRYGEKATREALKDGAIIRAWEFFTLQAGYKVTSKDGETLGYIVGDLFHKLHNDGTITKAGWYYSYTDYAAPVVITYDDEPAETVKRQTRDILNGGGIVQAINYLFTCDYSANDARAVLLLLGVDDAEITKAFSDSFGVMFSTFAPAAPFRGNAARETATTDSTSTDSTSTDSTSTDSTSTAAAVATAPTPTEYAADALRVSISNGNRKMGYIKSVSLPACTTCNPSAPCFKKCYARRLACRYKNTRDAYDRNLEILRGAPAEYWRQVREAAATQAFFRYHVSGDIPDAAYFAAMVTLARELPHTTFLAFTKQYAIINAYLNACGVIPSNLRVILSNWGAWKCDNPHGLPVCEVIFKGETPRDNWFICGGNCTTCACRGVGCWQLKHGDTVAIYAH